ncbi:MAG: sirohydrochlorin cobaltochelatase, partial [Schwartzia sp.]|nr:sirohydrochlorin cobaltochelatase [Schwartzia sp. (in: firmicutes)]
MKKGFKKYVAAAAAVASLFSFQLTSEAAYQLSSEVKDATPALLQAAQIGVLTNENPELQELENKDAIVVMSFGTTYKETRAKTIHATVKEIQAAHPNTKVVVAFTSHIIIDRIQA